MASNKKVYTSTDFSRALELVALRTLLRRDAYRRLDEKGYTCVATSEFSGFHYFRTVLGALCANDIDEQLRNGSVIFFVGKFSTVSKVENDRWTRIARPVQFEISLLRMFLSAKARKGIKKSMIELQSLAIFLIIDFSFRSVTRDSQTRTN